MLVNHWTWNLARLSWKARGRQESGDKRVKEGDEWGEEGGKNVSGKVRACGAARGESRGLRIELQTACGGAHVSVITATYCKQPMTSPWPCTVVHILYNGLGYYSISLLIQGITRSRRSGITQVWVKYLKRTWLPTRRSGEEVILNSATSYMKTPLNPIRAQHVFGWLSFYYFIFFPLDLIWWIEADGRDCLCRLTCGFCC